MAGKCEHEQGVAYKGLPTTGIWGGFDGMEEFHVANVVKVDLVLQNDNQALPVQSYGKNRGWEGEFAYG